MGGKDSWALVVRPPGSRKRARTGGPRKKPVSYIHIDDDDNSNMHYYKSLSLRNSLTCESGGIARPGGRGGGAELVCIDDGGVVGNSCGREIVDDEVGCRSGGDDDDLICLSGDGCVGSVGGVHRLQGIGSAGGQDGLCNDNGADVGDSCRGGLVDSGVGELAGSCLEEDDVSDADPDYKLFLEMLRVDGSGYSLEVPLSDGLSLVVAYEVNADSSGGEPGVQTMPDSRKQNGKEIDRSLLNCSQREQATVRANRGPKGTKRKFTDVPARVKKRSWYLEKKASKHVPRRPDMLASKSPSLRNLQAENDVISDLVDSSYQNLLNSLKKDGNQIFCDLGTGERMIYEQDEQSSSNSDVMVLDTDPFKSCQPLVVLHDDDEEEVTGLHSRSYCPQDMQLLELLKQPYDKRELTTHMEEFQRRPFVEGCKELRSGCKRYKTEVVGLSYEDRHTDLADQIRSSKCEHKTLNLLRGFFYWLQNLVHGSMDKPWKDPAYLEVLPAGRSGKAEAKSGRFKIADSTLATGMTSLAKNKI